MLEGGKLLRLQNYLSKRHVRDALAVFSTALVIIVAAIQIEAFEAVVEFSKSHESWELDELLVATMVSPIAFVIYAYRRLLDAQLALSLRIQAEKRANEMALHDPLTGLPNRRKAEAELATAILKSRNDPIGALAIDLNRFKPVNDLNGHAIGDQLLVAVGERLKSTLGENGSVYRMGGDEFLIVAKVQDGNDLIRLAKMLSETFEAPFALEAISCTIGASIGAVWTSCTSTDPDDLLAMADAAMYRCKAAGRNGYAFFEEGMEVAARTRAKIEAELRDAIANGQIEPHYQPLVELGSKEIVGFEALARWRLADGSYRMPNDFITAAEETGLISELFFSILKQACLEVKNWPPHIRVAVNLSPVQFADEWLVSRILGILTETGVASGRLEIEITENALVANFEEARRIVNELRQQGIHIALDDFGTGYSSLRHLSELRFDKLKIDRAFIHDVNQNATSEAIVRAVTLLAHNLGLMVTAEGIETPQNAAEVGAMGCDIGQGYYFGRPIPSNAVEAFQKPHKQAHPNILGQAKVA